MTQKKSRVLYHCPCPECSEHPANETARLHASINHVSAAFDEKSRRRFVGLLSMQYGYGGVIYVASITGLSRTTILRGQREVQLADADLGGRIRAPGGGGRLLEKKTQH